MTRVAVEPELIRWACRRASVDPDSLGQRFPQLDAWQRAEREPTLKQLEAFAKATHTPIGFFFLSTPPAEDRVPIPDFRTIAGKAVARPSPDLLDTIYLCQQRQIWYRGFAQASGDEPVDYVGCESVQADVTEVAARIRERIGFDLEERRRLGTWTEALRRFIEQIDTSGTLVMVSGVVGSNNRRKLDPGEFRGFALVDPLAPLIFINGADTKAAQMFTLAHELAHLWIGQTALSDSQVRWQPDHSVERWCNEVAAEVLVPAGDFRQQFQPDRDLRTEMDRLARRYKVSTLVILRRVHDIQAMDRDTYRASYDAELARVLRIAPGSGGDFYLTLGARVSKRFARAICTSTLEGRSSYTEAFRLLGFKKMATFERLALEPGL